MDSHVWNINSDKIPSTSEELLKIILGIRGIEDMDSFVDILEPMGIVNSDSELKTLYDRNVKNAVQIIKQTIKDNKPIIIHGDYDADGQTATAILWRTLYNDLLYKNVFPFIPNRFDHGYGLSDSSIEGVMTMLNEKGFEVQDALLITVDCGIVSVKEVEDAKEKGFKVIITDHHQPEDKTPDADELVWTDRATGAGIAWLISNELRGNPQDRKYLDLAAIGTICDLQPLTNLNRAIAKYGLEELNREPTLGVNILAQGANVKGEMDTYHIGWVIGPRLNATGRLESAMDSLRLLSTDSYAQARELSSKLNSINEQRQEKTKKDLDNAVEEFSKVEELPNFIITSSEDYHEGIIGLVAGRLVQTYYRPSLAITYEKDSSVAKGSARSIEGISLIETLRKFDDLFEALGGHDMAAGFSIKRENIEKLYVELNKLDDWDKEIFIPKIKVDVELPSPMINIDVYNDLSKLKPFGTGNYEPTFVTRGLEVVNLASFGRENNHLKLFLKDHNDTKFTALQFQKGEEVNKYKIGSRVDVVHQLTLNTWNGNESVELKVRGIKES